MDGGAEVIEGAGREWVDVEGIYWLGTEPLAAGCVGRTGLVVDTGDPDDAFVPLLATLCICVD